MPQFDRLGNDMSDDIADALSEEEDCAETLPFGAPVVGNGTVDDMAADAEPYYYMQDELTGYEEHERDSQYDMYVRCPHHGEIISNGIFDGVCGGCEHEGDERGHYLDWMEELAASGPTCTDNGFKESEATCRVVYGDCLLTNPPFVQDDEIPF